MRQTPKARILAGRPAPAAIAAQLRLGLALLCCCACNTILGNEERDPLRAQVDASDNSAYVNADAGAAPGCSELDCGPFGHCAQSDAGARCECDPGYVLRGPRCEEQDECSLDNGGCPAHSVCIDLPATRECVCKTGYRWDPDQNGCRALCDDAGCDPHASCTIVGDRALCTCLAPYTGNGLTCTFDETCASYHCDQNARCLGGGPKPCVCSDGFAGDGLTCTRVDACAAEPCKNGGQCVNETGSFFCNCQQTGFRGALCEVPIDDCTPNPCAHGACRDLVNDYACECALGYSGRHCEIDIDDCAAAPCVRGQCQDGIGDYSCLCPAGYSGKNCDNDIDNCAGNPCARGTCVDQVDGFVCRCPPGYEGARCENNRDDCTPNPCQHGVCSDRVDGFECSCAPGYSGARCENDIDDCAGDPCVHGSCSDRVNGFACTCEVGWGGARCDTGSCANVSCPNAAPCRVPRGAAGICYPSECGSEPGLCMAENPDGSGAASTELISDENSEFDFGSKNNWNKRARYFAYINPVDDRPHVCVYPEQDYKGMPLIIPLGESRSTTEPFGQSNAWSDEKSCP